MLFNEWSVYSTNFNTLSNWIESIKEILLHFYLNEKITAKEFNKCLEELANKTSCLLSLKVDAEKICSNSSLHHLAKKNIEISYNALCSSMQSVKKALLYYQEILNDLLEISQSESQIQSIQTSLNAMDLALYGTMPSNKLEMETELSNTEKQLQDVAQHYAYLLYVRNMLILEDHFNFTMANSVALSLLKIKDVTSRLSNYYLKLIETAAKNSTFLENCMTLVQLLRKLKNLHSVDVPVDYLDLIAHFTKLKVMEIYVHGHQIVMQKIINSDAINSSVFSSRTDIQSMFNIFHEFVEEWETLENAYRRKINAIQQKIGLWQNYWFYKCKIKSSLKLIRKEISERTLISNSDDPKEEITQISELKSYLEDTSKAIYLIQQAADELMKTLKNPDIEKAIVNEISSLKHEIEMELEALKSRKIQLNETENTFVEFFSIFENNKEKMSSLQLYITESIPSSFEETRKVLEGVEMKKLENAKALEVLCSMDISKLKDDKMILQIIAANNISVQKTFNLIMSCGLNQYAYSLQRNLDRLSVFNKKHSLLIKWCEKYEKKLKQDLTVSPDRAIKNLKTIQEKITLMKPEFDNSIFLGNVLSNDDEIMPSVYEKVSSLNLALFHVEELHAQRSAVLFKIAKIIEDLSENSRKLDKFLMTIEDSLELSEDIKKLSYEEIQHKLNYIQTLLTESNIYSDIASYIENHLKDDCFTDYSNNSYIQNILQYSQGVLLRWTILKEVISKKILILKNTKCLWDQFFNALEELEKWLASKEEIVSKTNYSSPGHSRNTYLDGVAQYEKLNHSFQDDIQILHSVNVYFHDIEKNDLKVNTWLKTRVSSANDNWHKLYKRVSEEFEVLKNILQVWDDFDQLKEHLLLFLTEVDIKLTELETVPSFFQSSCESIEEDFKLHEDEKQRFVDLAKQLMEQNDSSISIIQTSLDEVMNYWEELYKHFLSLKEIHKKTIEQKEIVLQYPSDTESESCVLKVTTQESLENISTFSETDSDNLTKKSAESMFSENEPNHTKLQTYSEVAATPLKHDDNKIETVDYFVPVVEPTSSEHSAEKVSKTCSEKQNITHPIRSKQKSFDDECIKDLLSALKEAAERMDSLEKVLSEMTPSGIDEHSLNYSRLLAACRSSVDVIQHLSQILFYDIPQESNRSQNDEIKIQSEDLLERWQKIENLALDKEARATDNKTRWENFSSELKGFETWIQKAVQDHSSAICSDADIEKLTHLLQRHKELISQIRAQKKTVLTLNLTGQKFLSASSDAAKVTALKQRIKTVNDHWDKLYSIALHCQNNLQTEFLQSSEFRSMFDEMKSWLKESEKRIDEMSQIEEKNDSVLHMHHTEYFALKQQLEVYCNRLETLLEITYNLFLPELNSGENADVFEAKLEELQEELKSNLKLSQSLLIKCTEMLKNVSSSLGLFKFQEHISQSQSGVASVSGAEPSSADRSECCSFLMRVARASFPIQAILLLLLGAAILLPMEEEEELSCRLSNNFASSLNPMLRYPDGPPPV